MSLTRGRYVVPVLLLSGVMLDAQVSKPATEPGVVTTGQVITPAGIQAVFSGQPKGVAFGAGGDELWALVDESNGTHLYGLSATQNKVVHDIPVEAKPGTQSLQFDARSGSLFFAATARATVAGKASKIVRLLRGGAKESPVVVGDALGRDQVGAVAISREADKTGARIAVVPLTYNNQLAVIDVTTGTIKGKLPTGIAPFGAVVDAAGTVAYVSNWAGRIGRPGDRTMTAGNLVSSDTTDKPGPDPVVIDKHGMASTGTVTRMDLASMQATDTIDVGLHPTALAWDEPHARLYVANSNQDSVSVIDTRTQKIVATIGIQPFRDKAPGLAPTALAIDARRERLYVACGGINAIAVIDTAKATVLGLMPTAWYPSSLSLSPDGRHLGVGALLGIGSGWQMTPAEARAMAAAAGVDLPQPSRRYVYSLRGTVSIVDIPEPAQLASFTVAVAHNNHLPLASAESTREDAAPRPDVAAAAVPERVGEPSLISHVVYIIKENRTYDQMLGDLGRGNGDPSLALYGNDVTPNHRRLVNQFVLLDNFYATGGNSGDGHQWLTQANETEYTLWPGYGGRSYPWGGDDPIAVARGGFIWDAALEKGHAVQIFGEYAGYGYPEKPTPEQVEAIKKRKREPTGEELQRKVAAWRAGEDFSGRYHNVAPNPAVDAIMAHDYPAWGSEEIPDVVRAQVFQSHVKGWERDHAMPNLVIVHLPRDHTEGTAPGRPTPRASIADNDWALGQIVETLSHSSFWPRMAIFVVEDDAQDGVDHVDGHRTVALAISPYTRRGAIDSTFYAQQSMLKTIELMLGLKPLSIFDLTATPMRASFQNTPDLAAYTAVEPNQAIDELNQPLSTLQAAARRDAIDSMKMRFDTVDAAPSDRLNRILWHDARGWKVPYPKPRAAVFSPFSLNVDDDDRDEH